MTLVSTCKSRLVPFEFPFLNEPPETNGTSLKRSKDFEM